MPAGEHAKRIAPLLAQVGLQNYANHFPVQLSGGLQQRAQIARSLALQPKVLLMDEPFGALDAMTRQSLQDKLLRLASNNRMTVLFITHDLEEAIYLGDRVIALAAYPGRVAEVIEVDLPRPRDQLATREIFKIPRALASSLPTAAGLYIMNRRAFALPVITLAVWVLAGRTISPPTDSTTRPSDIASALISAAADGSLLKGTAETLGAAASGFAIAVIFGVGLAIPLGLYTRLRNVIGPSIELVRPVPPVALIPLGILIFGFGPSMETMIIAFACIWPSPRDVRNPRCARDRASPDRGRSKFRTGPG